MTVSPNDANLLKQMGFTSIVSTLDTLGSDIAWTNDGSTIYLTTSTLDLALGGTDSTARFFFDYSAYKVQLLGTASLLDVRNDDSTQSARVRLVGIDSDDDSSLTLQCLGPSYSGSGALAADSGVVIAGSGLGNGLSIVAQASSASATIRAYVGGTTSTYHVFTLDKDSTATYTRLLLYDVDSGAVVRVSVGAADSGGSGYKTLRIPN